MANQQDNRLLLAPLLGWIVPGLGHAYLGRRGKGLFFGILILALFAGGVLLSGGHSVSWARERLWFLGEAGALAPTLLAAWISGLVPQVHVSPHHQVGLLYTTVAGLLNVVVAMDAFGIALAASRGERS
jgi:TM2 domain-containing membrane protein YozV